MKKHDLIDFLALAAEHKASDLHLTVGSPPMMRVAGVIQPLTEEPLSAEDTRRLVVDTLKEAQRARLENEWQLDFALEVGDLGRYRGNACYVTGAIEANFRRIPDEVGDLKSLGHSPVVDRWCDGTRGLILVTGASGEGKSTTLASMAQTIANRRSVNIVSIEDPIEFVHKQGRSLVNQREIGSDARDFASALKNALRQDADVILVGEMRDADTMQTAITAAETGHLVIGTMHTNDAPTAIGRIIDAFPSEGQQFVAAQLAWSLLGVVCQYLLPRSGETGLVLASELMIVNSGIEACIRDRRLSQIPGLIQIGRADGMHTVDESLIELLIADRISLMDAMAHARDPNFVKEEFQKALKSQRKGWFSGIFGK
ncbi:MAG: type IV pili twitching motility protein PilT [Verrucomicrobia bacterium]|nr:MAG: type IV pili twitching motility protein PilT [Verrucomicrobiota bacterium]PYL78503.1 MAG: type IV pili twitching motility protein PilT [Verrucomicrobiota bacterium]